MAVWDHESKRGSPRSRPLGTDRRPDIQGLRGLAVLLVVLYHAGVPLTPGGFVGVDVFFVISGFLITGLLMREVEATGRIRYVAFIARRARRLLPAALVVIAFVGAASVLVYPPLERLDVASAARAASLYIANLWFAGRAVDYFGVGAASNPMLHMWSLAVEEQFYLAWPAVLALAAFGLKSADPRLRVTWVVAALSGVSLALCVWMTWHAQPWAFFGTPFRAWEFGLGALVYLLSRRVDGLPRNVLTTAANVGLVLVIASAIALTDEAPFPGAVALAPTLGASLILASLDAPGLARGLLSSGPMARIGDVSYSWYLWHWPLLVILPILLPEHRVPAVVAAVAISYLAAEVSYRYVEEPFRHGFAMRIRPRYVMLSALFLTVGSATLLTLAKEAGNRSPQSARQQQFIDARGDISPVFTRGCHVDIWHSEVVECGAGPNESSHAIVLLGDSHAAHWFPALEAIANVQGWRLVSMTKSGCPWVDVSVRLSQMRRAYIECEVWRERAFRRIEELRPAMVFLANSRRNEVTAEAWEAGARKSVATLSASSTRLVLMRDTPRPGFDVPTCLARSDHIGLKPSLACAFSLTKQLAPTLATFEAERRAVAGLGSTIIVDMTEFVCPQERCPVVSEGVIHFHDYSHLTATFSRKAAPALAAQLGLPAALPAL